jgi:hypothetical protein
MNAKDKHTLARLSSAIGTFLFAWLVATIIHTRVDGCLDALVLGWIGGCVFTTFFYLLLFLVLHNDGDRMSSPGRRKDD